MKQINNYVSEKLYISREYKGHRELKPEEFEDLLKKKGVFIQHERGGDYYRGMLVIIVNKGVGLKAGSDGSGPALLIKMFNHYWTEFGDDAKDGDYFTNEEKNRMLKIAMPDGKEKQCDAMNLEIIEEEGYKYTVSNAVELANILKNI